MRRGEAARLRRPVPRPRRAEERAAYEAEGRAVGDPVRHARARVGRRRPREGRDALRRRRAARLRARAQRRLAGVPAGGRRRRPADGHDARRSAGEDLLASAPRNAAVFEALGGTPPRYAHLPLVLGPDRQPLSKRHGSTSVESFREHGFLPEALVNYLALLGWSTGDDHEILQPRRARRGVRPRPRLVQPGRVRHREAHLDEQPLIQRLSTTTSSRHDASTS